MIDQADFTKVWIFICCCIFVLPQDVVLVGTITCMGEDPIIKNHLNTYASIIYRKIQMDHIFPEMLFKKCFSYIVLWIFVKLILAFTPLSLQIVLLTIFIHEKKELITNYIIYFHQLLLETKEKFVK